jgi:hypothetical protein
MDALEINRVVNATDSGWRVIAVAVPTRALRVIVEDLNIKFRVEQLDSRNWKWFPISLHTGDEAWESLGFAIQEMCNKQARYIEKIKLAQHENNMARIKAENPLGN